MSQEQSQNGVLSVWLISLGVILALITGLYFININIGIEDFSNIVSLPVYTIIPGTLVVLSIWAVIKSDTIKKLPKNSLIFLTIAFSCWFIAEQTWNLYEHVLEIDPYPSAADFFYLAAPLFMFIALLIFLKGKKTSNKSLVISSIISFLILIPSIIATLEASAEDELLESIIAIVYPVVDAIMLVPVIIIIGFLISKKRDFFWIMIISGIIIMLVADTGFLFLVINDEYEDGHPIDILWVSAYTIWAFMMLYIIIQSKKSNIEEFLEINKKQNAKKAEKYGVLVALFLINITVILLLAGINYFIEPREDTILEFFSWILAMMVIIFSSIVIIMNSRLNKALQTKTEQLEETTKELIKSERFSAIGELASRIAHDIRNPLSNIFMSIEMMKSSPPDTKLNDQQINEKLDLVSKNIERISHQVNDVLGYVKNRTANKKIIKISKCIQESIETITIPPNITIKIPKSEMTMWADPFQMQIVFNNIIINAIQSLDKNPGEIIVRFSETEGKTHIEIENSGPEIPQDMLPHIFDSLVTTKQIGTGLGLVSCKTIIENHQGTISAKNNPTTFIIEIPKKN
ncbi:MAG: ATP-binding protein [Nitrosopumilaceae archaeon]